MKLTHIIIGLMFLTFTFHSKAQIINSFSSESPVTACNENGHSVAVSLSNGTTSLSDITIRIELGVGMTYIPGSITSLSGHSLTYIGSDLNKPVFQLPGLWTPFQQIDIAIKQKANCDARAHKVGNGTFTPVLKVFTNGSPVTLSGTNTTNHDVIYASLSITGASTTPNAVAIGGLATRQLTINNGSFGAVDTFYYADIVSQNDVQIITNSFVINPAGTNYAIPVSNIQVSGDTVRVLFDKFAIQRIANLNLLFETNENFILKYNVRLKNCNNSTSSNLISYWGCNNQVCQTANSTATLSLSNGVPNITATIVTNPNLEICGTTVHSVKVKNTATGAADFAKDVMILLGNAGNDNYPNYPGAISMFGWKDRVLKNFKINGIPVVISTLTPVVNYSNYTQLPYLPANWFASDPDGLGVGLEDLDSDGFYDDLAPNAEFLISFEIDMKPAIIPCGLGGADYDATRSFIGWEHIQFHVTVNNQCGLRQPTVRPDLNYGSILRDYITTTSKFAPSDVVDNQSFQVTYTPNLYNHGSVYNCNGKVASANDANGSFYVQLTLPPGIVLDNTIVSDAHWLAKSPTISAAGNVVRYRINGLPNGYLPFTFNLKFLCAQYNGATTLPIPVKTIYECANASGVVCFSQDIHCDNLIISPHCPGNCKGVVNMSMTAERTTAGWTDETLTTFAPIVTKDYYLPFDTMKVVSLAQLTDTAVSTLKYKVFYTQPTAASGLKIAEYARGFITIIDKSASYNGGKRKYVFPITIAPTVTNTGTDTYQFEFDLSSYKSLINANYLYGGDVGSSAFSADSVFLTTFFSYKNIQPYSTGRLENFRSRFYSYRNTAPTTEWYCEEWGALARFKNNQIGNYDWTSTLFNCESKSYAPHYVGYSSPTGDAFPGEIRPFWQVDSIDVTIPVGFEFKENAIWDINGVLNINRGPLTNYRTLPGNILRFPMPYRSFDDVSTQYPQLRVDLQPTCEAATGAISYPMKLYWREYTYHPDPANHVKHAVVAYGSVNFTRPNTLLSIVNQTVQATKDTVNWDINICNNTPDQDIAYNWLAIYSPTGKVKPKRATLVVGATETPLTIQINGDTTFVKFDNLNRTACKQVRIYSTYSNCTRDSLVLYHGWACGGTSYPSVLKACGTANKVYVNPQPAAMSLQITALQNTPSNPSNASSALFGSPKITMCQPFPVEIKLIGAQPSDVYNSVIQILNPSGGGTYGLDYIANSAYIEYPLGTSPRPLSSIGEAALVASNNTIGYPLSLATIDPTNFGIRGVLKGVGDAPLNQVIIRLQLKSNCNLSSGEPLMARTFGIAPCGSPAIGNGETTLGYQLRINGVTEPYATQISVSMPANIESCGSSVVVPVSMTKIGSNLPLVVDSLSITIPKWANFNNATPIACTSALCVSGNPVVKNRLDGFKDLMWQLPSSWANGQSINFNLNLDTDDSTACDQRLPITVQTLNPQTIACGAMNCPNFINITGFGTDTTIIKKPILNLSANAVLTFACTAASTATIPIAIMINNSSAYATQTPIYIDIYEGSNAGCTPKTSGTPTKTITYTPSILGNTTVTINDNVTIGVTTCSVQYQIRTCSCNTPTFCSPVNMTIPTQTAYSTICGQAITVNNICNNSNFTYTWSAASAPAQTSDIQNISISNAVIRPVSMSGTSQINSYNVNVNRNVGCSTNSTVAVTVNKPNIGLDRSICMPKDSVKLTAAITGYTWSIGTKPAGSTPTIDAQGNLTNLTVAGVYQLLQTSGTNCSDEILVTVFAAPTFTLASSNVSCFGLGNGSITVSVVSGASPFQYSKDTGTTFQGSAIFNNLTPNTYNVVVKDANGCTKSCN